MLTFFRSGKFAKEELEAVSRATTLHGAANEGIFDSEEKAGDRNNHSVDEGLKQLERAGLIKFEQERRLYTFHQTPLDHLGRSQSIDLQQVRTCVGALRKFHAVYVTDSRGNDELIDRCRENILSTLDIAWGLREEEAFFDRGVCYVVGELGYYFERRGLWMLGAQWLERAIAIRRTSALERDRAAVATRLHQFCANYVPVRRARSGALFCRPVIHSESRVGQSPGLCRMPPPAGGRRTSARQFLRGNPNPSRIHRFERRVGQSAGPRRSLHQLAMVEHAQGNPAEARRLLQESIAETTELGDRQGCAAPCTIWP